MGCPGVDLGTPRMHSPKPARVSVLPVPDAHLLRLLEGKGPYELGESYSRGEWEAQHLDQLMFQVFSKDISSGSLRLFYRILGHVMSRLFFNPQRGRGAFRIGRVHYGLGNDLFCAMLDGSMSYTSGYWSETSTLEQAQAAKLDLICRKLELRAGMTVLDIGCGWGNFAKFAAEKYGVQVRGITVSKEQAEFARQWCRGLPVEIELRDYREFYGEFDRIVSIEMIEAVGQKNLPDFFGTVKRCLKPGGLFLLEVICSEAQLLRSSRCLDEFLMWILKYIFPNGYLPRLGELSAPCDPSFTIQDLHSFGLHYDRTLMAWASRFDSAWTSLKGRYDETFRRRWRFYLLSCAALFRAQRIQLYQLVYSAGPLSCDYSVQR